MLIKDLEARKAVDTIDLKIVSVSEPREFRNARGAGKVANAESEDETGAKVQVSFWNDDCEKIKEGDTIRIENGWVGDYQGTLQLSTGKFGKLTINPEE